MRADVLKETLSKNEKDDLKKNAAPIRGLYFLAALIPFLVTAFTAFRFCLEILRSDEWSEIPLISKAADGAAGFSDFWAQHNEHRIFFPRLVLVPLAVLSRWDLRCEIVVNLLLALGTFSVFNALILREDKIFGQTHERWLPAALSVLIFSLRQGENWVWGIEMVIFMAVFSAVLAFYMLSREHLGARVMGAAILCAVVSSYSFGAGLFVWPTGLFILLLRETARVEKVRNVLVWAAAGTLSVIFYFHDFVRPHHLPSLFFGVHHPAVFYAYFFKYLGSPLFLASSRAFAAGVLGSVVFVLSLLFLLSRETLSRSVTVAASAPGIFVLLTGFTTALSRCGFSAEQAMAERYTTISSLFWVSLVLLLVLVSRELGKNARQGGSWRWGPVFPLCLCGLIVLQSAWVSHKSYEGIKSLREAVHLAGREVLLEQPWISYDNLYPRKVELEQMLKTLKRRQLNIFDPAKSDRLLSA